MRSQAIWGLLLCAIWFTGVAYVYNSWQLSAMPPSLVSITLVTLIALILLLALITHPRRAGCRFYAILVTLCTAIGLWLVGKHIWIQIQLDSTLAACTSTEWAPQLATIAPQFRQLMAGVDDCYDAVNVQGMPVAYLVLLSFIIFGLFSLYLLFMRIDRPIFR